MMPTTLLALGQINIPVRDLLWTLRTHPLWAWMFIGIVAGWLTGFALRGRRFGCLTDIILGVAGAICGGWLFTNFRVMNGDFGYSLGAAAIGSLILIAIARLFAAEPKK